MTSNDLKARHQALSEAVDKIFKNYTTVPSSETEDEGVQASDLLIFERNSDTKDDATATIEPQKMHLPSTSNAEVYARKTIPSASAFVEPQVEQESDIEIFETERVSFSPLVNYPPCEDCYEHGTPCSKKTRGRACIPCASRRKKCSLVPERSPKPGARGTSTDNSSKTSGQSSSNFSFEDDTGDESFELDCEKVTLQRILGHVIRLNRKQEERFKKIESSLKELKKEVEGVCEVLGRLSAV